MMTEVQTLTSGRPLGCFLCSFTLLTIMVTERGSLLLIFLRVVLWTSLVTWLLAGLLAILLLGQSGGLVGSSPASLDMMTLIRLLARVDMGMTVL